jgi:Tol biopolymer transport system component
MSATTLTLRKLAVVAAIAGFGSAIAFVLVASAAAGSSPATTLVSVSKSGTAGDRDSFADAVSADGRVVLFSSQARNLVRGDTNGRYDVFVRQAGITQRVSVGTGGAQAKPTRDPSGGSVAGGLSADGRLVVYASDATNLVPHDTNKAGDVFLYDRGSGVTKRLSVGSRGGQANAASFDPEISADGRYVAFTSGASNLVRGDTNGLADVFVRELNTGKTIRVSVTSHGGQARCNLGYCESTEPVLSASGRFVAFQSSATNLVLHDTNRLGDVFVHDLRTGRTERVSVTSAGKQAGRDRTNNGSNAPAISADGRFVAFHSADSNLVKGDTNGVFDIFLHDRKTGRTTRVSVGSRGQANAESLGAVGISADGRYVAFTSLASNLTPGDANEITDAFVRDLRTSRITLASLDAEGRQGHDSSAGVAFGAGDRLLVLSSYSNLSPADQNIVSDVYLRDLSAGKWYSASRVESSKP